MERIIFEFNWCDYFTPCTYMDDRFVGDFDCSICKHNCSMEIIEPIKTFSEIGDAAYIKRGYGCVNCSFKKDK